MADKHTKEFEQRRDRIMMAALAVTDAYERGLPTLPQRIERLSDLLMDNACCNLAARIEIHGFEAAFKDEDEDDAALDFAADAMMCPRTDESESETKEDETCHSKN